MWTSNDFYSFGYNEKKNEYSTKWSLNHKKYMNQTFFLRSFTFVLQNSAKFVPEYKSFFLYYPFLLAPMGGSCLRLSCVKCSLQADLEWRGKWIAREPRFDVLQLRGVAPLLPKCSGYRGGVCVCCMSVSLWE